MKASILDLRRRMRSVLRALDRQEAVTILYRGKPRGVIVPAGGTDAAKRPIRRHPAFGMWRGRDDLRDVPEAVRRLRKGRHDAV